MESGHVQKALQDNQGVLLSSIRASAKGPNSYLNQRFVFVVFNKFATKGKERQLYIFVMGYCVQIID